MEKLPGQSDFKLTDYDDTPYYSILKKLPKELAANHVMYIEAQAMTDSEAIEYLNDIANSRQEVMSSSVISDRKIEELVGGNKESLFRTLETTVYNSADNYLGTGMTAKVKLFELSSDNPENKSVSMAIKYVVTPTEKTLTAEQEHNVIKEVERIKTIELAESAYPKRSRYIRVPHPYLYHSTPDIQLYGMECVDGITLEQALREGMLHKDMREALKNSRLAEVSVEEMDGFIKRFFDTMHEYCLHGDIKPRNIMVSRDGIFYIIDFGQSLLSQNFDDKVRDNFENLKDDEIKSTQITVRSLFRKIFEDV